MIEETKRKHCRLILITAMAGLDPVCRSCWIRPVVRSVVLPAHAVTSPDIQIGPLAGDWRGVYGGTSLGFSLRINFDGSARMSQFIGSLGGVPILRLLSLTLVSLKLGPNAIWRSNQTIIEVQYQPASDTLTGRELFEGRPDRDFIARRI